MNNELSGDRLEAVLASIGHHLEIPPSPAPSFPLAPAHPSRPARLVRPARPAGRLLAAAAAAVVVVALVLLVVPSTRAAIADLLGIGSTRIEIGGPGQPDRDHLPHIAQGLDAITIEEASALLDGGLPDTGATILGPPDAVYRMPEGGVLLAWQADSATLWVHTTPDAAILLRKLVSSGQDVEPVDGVGTEALLVTGPHFLETPQRLVAAGTVLLWYEGDREYRLEADRPGPELIEIARSLG